MRYPVTADGCVWRNYRRTWSGSTAQPFLQDCAAECIVIFRWNKICAYNLNSGISVCRSPDVLYLADSAERNLCTRRSGDRNRIFRNTALWYHKESTYSIRTAPCILHAVLADSSRWNDGGCRTYGRGWTEHLLRTAC